MTVTLTTLGCYALALIAIGVWASARNVSNEDFLLGGRRLGPWIAALSASASSSSAWTLLGVSGAAYVWGLSALWLFPATVGGFLLNWFVVAPRLRAISATDGALTLTEVIAPAAMGEGREMVLRGASLIVLFSFIFYIASQFEGAAKAFEAYFGWSRQHGVVLGAGIVLFYTLAGGFWAASVSDALQGIMMVAVAVLLPVAGMLALAQLQDPGAAWRASFTPAELSLSGGLGGFAALGFALGTLGIGLGYPGQPHVVNRFMALRDEPSVRRARLVACLWAVFIYAGMLFVGLSARVLYASLADGEQVLFEYAERLMPGVLSAILLAAVLSAIMSTADSQLLVAASTLSHDWHLQRRRQPSRLATSRLLVVLLCAAAGALALYLPKDIFSRVLFAWHALGSAFGPLVILRIFGFHCNAGGALATLACGFGLTVIFNWLPNTPGDWVERLMPLAVAFVIAWSARRC